jgi:hypothetical protein
MLFSSSSKDSYYPTSRSRATILWPVLSYPLQRTLPRSVISAPTNDLFFRHRSWTWTEPYSFEQATSQTWCHSETSVVKAGKTNVWDDAILPPTASGHGSGTRFFSTDCVRWWRWCTPLSPSSHFSAACPEKTRVGTSKIIIDFYPVICLVQWIMGRLGKFEREVVKKLDYQW